MSFHRIGFKHIKLKKPIISSFDLLSTNYVGIDIVRIKENALLGIADKYTTLPIKNFLVFIKKLNS